MVRFWFYVAVHFPNAWPLTSAKCLPKNAALWTVRSRQFLFSIKEWMNNQTTNEVTLEGLATGSQRSPSRRFTLAFTHPCDGHRSQRAEAVNHTPHFGLGPETCFRRGKKSWLIGGFPFFFFPDAFSNLYKRNHQRKWNWDWWSPWMACEGEASISKERRWS